MIITKTDYQFNCYQLINNVKLITDNYLYRDQINLKYCDDNDHQRYSDSLWDKKLNKYVVDQSQFNKLIPQLHDNYLCHVMASINNFGIKSQLSIGRIRINTLRPKSCLTYHSDTDSKCRLHIPVITNDKVFFIVDGVAGQMLEVGTMYVLDVTKRHTAINASRDSRVHIVADCY